MAEEFVQENDQFEDESFSGTDENIAADNVSDSNPDAEGSALEESDLPVSDQQESSNPEDGALEETLQGEDVSAQPIEDDVQADDAQPEQDDSEQVAASEAQDSQVLEEESVTVESVNAEDEVVEEPEQSADQAGEDAEPLTQADQTLDDPDEEVQVDAESSDETESADESSEGFDTAEVETEDNSFQPDLPWSHGLDDEFAQTDYPRPTMESVIEAILFASDEPISDSKLMNVAEISSTKQVRDCIGELNKRYEELNSAFKIEKIAGGYQMMTHRIYNHWLMKFVRVRSESKLSQAALETLAIIAYKQPVIKADVEAIRGVSSGEMIRSLITKGLVKVAGRAEILGRPMLYATTKKFLEVFGLNSLRDLPKAEELKKPRD